MVSFSLQVSDLTPNMGLFWYFFTEMFEHFRMFFLWVFQLNAFFYCIPMTIKLRYVLVSLEFVSLSPSTFSSERKPWHTVRSLWSSAFSLQASSLLGSRARFSGARFGAPQTSRCSLRNPHAIHRLRPRISRETPTESLLAGYSAFCPINYSPLSQGGHIAPGDQKSFVLPR